MASFLKFESGDFVPRQNPTAEDLKSLHTLLTNLGQSHTSAKLLTDDIQDEIKRKVLFLYTVEKLSRWCEARGAYKRGAIPAKNLSRFLFGFVLPRLIDENSQKVADYDAQIALIEKKFNQHL